MANRIFRPLVDWAMRRRAVAWVLRNRKEIALYGWPVFLFECFNWTYDHFGFLVADRFWGEWKGSLIATGGAFALNILIFFGYDWMKKDWLRAKVLRDLSDDETKTGLEKILTAHRKPRVTLKEKLGGIIRFVGSTAFIDPVILAIHYRESYFTGISKRDWGILLGATASGSLIWSVLMALVSFAITAMVDLYEFLSSFI